MLTNKNRPGRKSRDVALKYEKRYISLPPDVAQALDRVPDGERSRLIARLLRAELIDKEALCQSSD